MRFVLLISALIGCGSFYAGTTDSASVPKKCGKQFYFTWGYTRAAYSKSTLHFRNVSHNYNEETGRYDDYDFTVYNATAHDRPDFEGIKNPINITIPQFVFRLGITLNEKWGLELNYDHTKYIVDDHQRVHVKGVFDQRAVDQD